MISTEQLAVIISGLVAVGSLLVSPIISLRLERIKWDREQKAMVNQEINQATVELLSKLQFFSVKVPQVQHKSDIAVAEMELRQAYFSWEMTVGAYCKKHDEEFLKDTSKKILGSPYTLPEYHPELTNKVLDFSKDIRNRA